jgi:hypothetical protein
MKLFLALFLAIWSVASLGADGLFSPPDLPKAKAGSQCVDKPELMRKQHMQHILHQRNQTMRHGVRDSKNSLVECVNCHVTKNAKNEFPSIDDKQHFCAGCHQYASVKIDCFECHASKPEVMVGGKQP